MHEVDARHDETKFMVEVEEDNYRALCHADAEGEIWLDGEVVFEDDDYKLNRKSPFPVDVVLDEDVGDYESFLEDVEKEAGEKFYRAAMNDFETNSLDEVLDHP